MSVIIRTVRLFPKGIITSRNFNTTVPYLVKEINERTENNALVVEGVNLPSPRAQKLLKEVCQSKFCPECTLGLEIKHTDVLILSQYVRSDGCMLPQRITGLCRRQQKRIAMMVTMAQKAGLMSNLTPANSKKDPKRRFAHKKFNTYFLESTIKY
ncbi:28S ribosomal protein S18a, mitochondrial-like [Teleopsis dalmanni]|uniref:28S ribosomal protein S18a, mitochondrial-like n=1 Tax=Teleopsis dalmanni TaxID=139649 RepID=UPI0018CE57D5|nr:28S ribosomal protein S18a, mitochondrial-like [Teleopsis dalmanni]XP_037951875.1 28S ribosomal protein S18a, mitochondrial-like [Teleopsis dalmanni]XP_037952954.1 28S ribosomal protein S18a, mitochondrial-like [Teleopsis dalmanni]